MDNRLLSDVHQLKLDELKLAISTEVASRFTVDEIRRRSHENLSRWKSAGAWGPVYEEWQRLLTMRDPKLLVQIMTGADETSKQLRQSMPYVGLLSQDDIYLLLAQVFGGRTLRLSD